MSAPVSTSLARPRWTDYLAIVLVLIGGVFVPLVGWLVGVMLLWRSNGWTNRDKWIGTLLPPGGLLPVLLLVGLGSSSGGGGCAQTYDAHTLQRVGPQVCTGGDSGPNLVAIVAAVVLVVLPLATGYYLVSRLGGGRENGSSSDPLASGT